MAHQLKKIYRCGFKHRTYVLNSDGVDEKNILSNNIHGPYWCCYYKQGNVFSFCFVALNVRN